MWQRQSFDQPVHQPPSTEVIRQSLIKLCSSYSIEVTPKTLAKATDIDRLLPPGSSVYVACLPGEDWQNVVTAAALVQQKELKPVPHIAARSLGGAEELDAYLKALVRFAGVDEVLVIGGGDRPQGSFSGTLDLLQTGLLERHGIKHVGLAGHPEGSTPTASPGLATTLEQKWAAADASKASFCLVTQFLFEAQPLIGWEGTIRGDGNRLPIHVGIPGPAKLKTLLNYAKLCGVGNSMRMLTQAGSNLLRLASIDYADRLLVALAQHAAFEPETRIAKLHFFPFGGIVRTAKWANAIKDGRFTMDETGKGFTVEPEAMA